MQSNSEPITQAPAVLPAAVRLERAQERIRALTTGRAALTAADRLELAEWQREWVAAAHESGYVAAA